MKVGVCLTDDTLSLPPSMDELKQMTMVTSKDTIEQGKSILSEEPISVYKMKSKNWVRKKWSFITSALKGGFTNAHPVLPLKKPKIIKEKTHQIAKLAS